jgi:hypothetical protein
VKGFIQYGNSTYRMVEITEAEMDKLIRESGDSMEWPYRFCPETKRVWPPPRKGAEVFYDDIR